MRSARAALALLGAVFVLALALGSCGGARKDDPILQLSSEEALEEGSKLMAEGKWSAARKYFIH